MSRARNFANLINSPKGAPVTVASSGNVTLDLSGNNSFYDAGTTTAATTVTFGTPDTTTKRFTYSFIPGYDNSASSVDDMDTWHFDTHLASNYSNHEVKIYNPTGTKMYTLDHTSDNLVTVNLAVPFDDLSASFYSQVHVGSGNPSTIGAGIGNKLGPGDILLPSYLRFNNDGTKLFLGGYSSDTVAEFHLSTPYDTGPASISYDSEFSVSGQEASPVSLNFNPTGTKMFIGGASGKGFDTYNLSTGFDVSTASHSSFDTVASFTNGPIIYYSIRSFNFNSDGTKVYFVRQSSNIHSFETADLSTPYDFSTATYINKFFSTAIHSQPAANYYATYNADLITLDRISISASTNGRIERGTSYHPTFSTSFTGYPNFYSRGYRHNLEFQTTDGGSSYQLLNHNQVQV